MRYILLFVLVAFASCEKKSDYKATCDIYGITTQTYNPNTPLAEVELYSNATRDEAEDQLLVFKNRYTNEKQDTFNKIKAAHPSAFIGCGIADTNE